MRKKRLIYLTAFLVLLLIEILIALYVHDDFVRPYIGDVLVVVVLYLFLRIFIPEKYPWLPGAIFLFATAVEISQSFHLAERLGVENNPFLRTILGAVYDIKDILCYGIGCALLAAYEYICRRRTSP